MSSVLRGLGPFVELATGPADDEWLPVARLVDEPELLAARVRSGRTALASLAGAPVEAVEERVVTSVVMLGVAARLSAPAIAAAAMCDAVLPVGRLSWRDGQPGPVPLLLPTSAHVPPGDADGLHAALVEDVLARLVDTARALAPLAPSLLWGNAASGIAGAAGALARARPSVAGAAYGVADALLARPPLRGAGAFAPGRRFRRGTCCLYYRLPGGGTCGDCPLPARA
ncbi:(2Fe-2S)-binding protein [Motilibacter aurantiacus]|uniref:(2Fe-2S)-binding protein n=1 Tax=Motilibacter aurantiacus TaxID=2714955 RepID=UPI00140E8EED|nr:(2Fe-2S)-binding protein [Motilibacter aurantiacus]NHC45543.1 (2Fe-2S)-binding protein [Motilibacter aurantiacus]